MGLIKIFSGNEVLALSLQQKIEEIGVNTELQFKIRLYTT